MAVQNNIYLNNSKIMHIMKFHEVGMSAVKLHKIQIKVQTSCYSILFSEFVYSIYPILF